MSSQQLIDFALYRVLRVLGGEEDKTFATKGRDGGLSERADEKQVKHSTTFTFSLDDKEKQLHFLIS